MSGSAFAVTHHAFSSGAGRTSDGNGSHASTLKSPSYTKSVSWQHYQGELFDILTLSLCYEKLNWEETAKICNTLNISEFTVIETMQAATKWADELAVC
ncbi:hypothetical protein AZ007_004713 [Citrobacter freundii]|nr:hypothetical protein AZ007_004713 [Citrobacter freundii]